MNKGIIHYHDSTIRLTVSSVNNRFSASFQGVEHEVDIELPLHLKFLARSRFLSRFFRISSSTALPLFDEVNKLESVLLVYNYGVYIWDLKSLKKVLNLDYCRNLMQNSIGISTEGNICFGEYGSNKNRDRSVPIYLSKDRGYSWDIVYTFEPGATKHVHSVQWDEYSEKFWICTGDSDGECHVLTADSSFDELVYYGDGTQTWRACSFIFTEMKVYWGMDSPLEPCHMVSFDRRTHNVELLDLVDGPVWYTKKTAQDRYIACTTVEPGIGCTSNNASVYYSDDLISWNKLFSFPKDDLPPRLFKFGSMMFSLGNEGTDDFFMSFEALKEYDGCNVFFKELSNEIKRNK